MAYAVWVRIIRERAARTTLYRLYPSFSRFFRFRVFRLKATVCTPIFFIFSQNTVGCLLGVENWVNYMNYTPAPELT
jgi:hypothetical protein